MWALFVFECLELIETTYEYVFVRMCIDCMSILGGAAPVLWNYLRANIRANLLGIFGQNIYIYIRA